MRNDEVRSNEDINTVNEIHLRSIFSLLEIMQKMFPRIDFKHGVNLQRTVQYVTCSGILLSFRIGQYCRCIIH